MTEKERRKQHHDLLFAARRSVRYHMHRQRFLDRIGNWGAVATAIMGSATFAALLADYEGLSAYTALATAVLSAGEIVFRPGRHARHHNELAREFVVLEQQALRSGPDPDPETLLALQTRRLDIEAGEPPVYRVLDAVCHDEVLRAHGYPRKHRSNTTGLQRFMMNVLDVYPGRLEKRIHV
ncbi:MAG: hypothetical protein OXH52_16220 [Gammaproteobacteria bacterium]|nr:hypothetical protein [Gammaproteobacteria bacterium]